MIISPFSVAQALSMLLNGADPTGQSFAQLQSVVFGAPAGGALPLPGVNTAMKALADELLDVSLFPFLSLFVWVGRWVGGLVGGVERNVEFGEMRGKGCCKSALADVLLGVSVGVWVGLGAGVGVRLRARLGKLHAVYVRSFLPACAWQRT